jgi:hypothetical protein
MDLYGDPGFLYQAAVLTTLRQSSGRRPADTIRAATR